MKTQEAIKRINKVLKDIDIIDVEEIKICYTDKDGITNTIMFYDNPENDLFKA